MKKNIISFLMGLVLVGCNSDSDEIIWKQTNLPNQSEGSVMYNVPLSKEQKSSISRNNDFAFNLFRVVSQSEYQKDKSLALSPLSLTFAMGMLNAGATGQTSKEINSMLGLQDEDREAVNALCKQLIEEVPRINKSVVLQMANCVAIDNALNLQESYQEQVNNSYHAEVLSLPFASHESVGYINDWCSRNTNGMIPRIIDQLSGVLALVNAVYFDAPWTHKFQKALTKSENFTKEDKSQVTLPMMHTEYRYDYMQDDDFSAISMPYGDGENWKMYVLLPHIDKTTTEDVINGLTEARWNKVLSSFERNRQDGVPPMIDVKLPSFEIKTSMDLNGCIKQLGATSMFLPQNELSEICNNKDLMVNLVKQNVAMEVYEDGTKASAATAIVMDVASLNNKTTPVAKFYANHPFVYLIQEASSGAIIFIGKYNGD
jgi:serpin B